MRLHSTHLTAGENTARARALECGAGLAPARLDDPVEQFARGIALAVPAGWALTRSAVASAVSNPLVRLPVRQIRWAEHVALRLLKQRLQALDRPRRAALELPPAALTRESAGGDRTEVDGQEARMEGHAAARHEPSLGDELALLLASAVEQSSAGSELAVFRRILSRLVPEEAAMLATLADGGPAAVVHVLPRGGKADRPALKNASSLGRRAGVTTQRLVPIYVEHLLELGLVDHRPEQPGLELEFEILMAETIVREALSHAKTGVVGPRVVRQTLQLSQLGRALWTACRTDRRAVG
jgi:hypothetical protein